MKRTFDFDCIETHFSKTIILTINQPSTTNPNPQPLTASTNYQPQSTTSINPQPPSTTSLNQKSPLNANYNQQPTTNDNNSITKNPKWCHTIYHTE